MDPEELLRLYPRETLRWLRRRLGLSQRGLARALGVSAGAVQRWEARHLATPEGVAFAQSLERRGEYLMPAVPREAMTCRPQCGPPPRTGGCVSS